MSAKAVQYKGWGLWWEGFIDDYLRRLLNIWYIITSANEVREVFVITGVCLSVRLSVCLSVSKQNISKSHCQIWRKLRGTVYTGQIKKWLKFWTDPDMDLYPRSFISHFQHCEMGNLGHTQMFVVGGIMAEICTLWVRQNFAVDDTLRLLTRTTNSHMRLTSLVCHDKPCAASSIYSISIIYLYVSSACGWRVSQTVTVIYQLLKESIKIMIYSTFEYGIRIGALLHGSGTVKYIIYIYCWTVPRWFGQKLLLLLRSRLSLDIDL